MNKGGYQILDFSGYNVIQNSATIKGTYNKIKNTTKAIMISGVFRDVFVIFRKEGVNYVTNISNENDDVYSVIITPNDVVTVSAG